MKWIFYILTCILLTACFKSKGDRVKDSVKKYLTSIMNDAASYQAVSFDIAQDVDNIRVYHNFRAKNGFGATMLYSYKLTLDSNYNVTSSTDLDEAIKDANANK